jgi:hypothetical protein
MVKTGIVALAVLATAVSQALAAPVLPGQSGLPVPGEPGPTGGVVVASSSVPFVSASGPVTGFSGTLTSNVIAGDPSNPYGGLTFTYQLSSDATSFSDIGRCTINGYSSWLTDMSYQIPLPAGDVVPSEMSRTLALGGDTVGFTYGAPPLSAGQTSAVMVVQTNAPSWSATTFKIIDGDVANVTSFAPAPEPATLSLAGVGVAALLLRRRK